MQEKQISRPPESTTTPATDEYVPPRIESVMKPEDLDREVQYAGSQDSIIFIA
jgi:hypothetical protein